MTNNTGFNKQMVYTCCPLCGHISHHLSEMQNAEWYKNNCVKCEKCKNNKTVFTDIDYIFEEDPQCRNIPAIKKSFEIKRKMFKEIIEPLGQLDTESPHYKENYKYLFGNGEDYAIMQAEQHMEDYAISEVKDKVANLPIFHFK